MKKIYLIDGSGFIFRAYHALPPLQRPDGTPVGAVYGFCSILMKLVQSIGDDLICVIFDAGRQTFRQEIYIDYKAHRPPAPEDLIPQFSLVRDACQAFGVPFVEMEGFEADDLIATYATMAEQENREVIIVSSDKDLMQLVKPNITMFDPMKNRTIDTDAVFEKFGVYPDFVIDVQALAGDSADNVPGVAGIGIKTAAQLINMYGSLEKLYESLDEIKQPKRRESLLRDKDLAFISKQLVTLKQDVPVADELKDFVRNHNTTSEAETFLKEQGFNSLVSRLHSSVQKEFVTEKNDKSKINEDISLNNNIQFDLFTPQTIQTSEQLDLAIQKIYEAGVVGIDTETTGLDIQKAQLVGVSLCIQDQSYYIPIGHVFGKQLPLNVVIDALKPICLNEGILKIGHNLKYDMGILMKYGLSIVSYDDTLLLSYVLFGNKHFHNLDYLSQNYLNHKTISFKDVAGEGKNKKTFDQVDIDQAAPYAGEDAQVTLFLWKYFKPLLLKQKQAVLYERAERPMVDVTNAMESDGILIDLNILNDLSIDFKERLKILEIEIHKIAGDNFNIGSPKQLGEILFIKLALPGGKKTKSGTYSTDNDVLEKLSSEGYEVAILIQKWRGLSKLQSTYIDGLREAISEKTGRIHTSYSLTATSTGRFSSSNPNLQNIPIRSEDGKKIRNAFIARPGYQLLSLDYSQIELRLLAHVADIKPLIEAFKNGVDIHKLTASKIFHINLQDVTSEQRYKAKAVNFGIIYGISVFGLAKQIQCTNGEASSIIQNYFATYPGILDYMENQKELAKKNGYVETIFGRKCYTPEIHHKMAVRRQFGERQAINAPLQGACADILKLAMTDVYQLLKEGKYESRLLLTVHDELVFEIKNEEGNNLSEKLKGVMENIVSLSVPLVVDSAIGNSWGDL